jgi:hypothetical protein
MTRGIPLIPGLLIAAAFAFIAGCSEKDGCACPDDEILTEIHVDVTSGDDGGTGAVTSPVKTIGRGLELARPGMTVYVAAGEYNVDSGEQFPLSLADSISLVGEDWMGTVIQGALEAGDTASAVVVISGTDCVFARFSVYGDTISNEIEIAASALRARVDSVRMPAASNVAISVGGAMDVTIEDCYAKNPKKCFCGTGIELASGDTGTIVRGCTLRTYENAMYFASTSDALVENCDLESNSCGFYLCCSDDPANSPNPDLGGGARGSLGGNTMADCIYCLTNHTPNTIYACFNTWNNDPPIEGEDFSNPGGGEVVW